MTTSFSSSTHASAQVLGYRLDCGTMASLLQAVLQQSKHHHAHVVTLNPEIIMRCQQNPAYGELVKHATLCLPDGAGVVWALRLQKIRQVRVPGIEFAEALLAHAAKNALPVALLGGKPGVVEQAVASLKAKHPMLSVGFHHHGFMKDEAEAAHVAEQLAATAPKLVLVAMGVPHQDFWIAKYKTLFSQPTLFVGVGGSFDVWSGTLKRAPKAMQALNLEWAYRFWQEPWRLQRSLPPLLSFVSQVVLRSSKG
jgi:N-acetylglucosaminyldiphosphoundecaprenol N-acetyl-beta-D-mannosaminyltransferase